MAQRGQGRKCNLVSRTEGQKVPRCLALTSPLSDSAIFLLRSMQRDECLIPISAGQNVSTLGEKRTDGGTGARLPPGVRPPHFYPPADQHSDPKTVNWKNYFIYLKKKKSKSKTTQGSEGGAGATEKRGGFHGAKVCSPPARFPGEHRVRPLQLPSRDWLSRSSAAQSSGLSYLRRFSPGLIESSVTATLCLKIAARPPLPLLLLPRRAERPGAERTARKVRAPRLMIKRWHRECTDTPNSRETSFIPSAATKR